MKTIRLAILGLVLALPLVSCGGSSSGSSGDSGDGGSSGSASVTVSITPSDSATSISNSATVKATFSTTITDPLSWFGLITLQANGTGETLCTGVSYDSDTKTVTCGHDTLSENTTYTVTVSGVTDSTETCVDDTTATFTTAGTNTVSSVEKTSITSTSGGSVDISFNFSAAVSSSITPSVSVSSENDTDSTVSAGDCTMNEARTSCTVTISGVDGCDDATDYYVTLSMTGFEDYKTFFNSADNEFETSATVDSNDCWERDQLPSSASSSYYSWSASDGNLVLAVSSLSEERDIYYDYAFNDTTAGAFAVYVSDLDTIATTGSVLDLIFVQATNSDFDGLNGIMAGYDGVASTSYTGWFSAYQAGSSDTTYRFGIPDSSGDLSDTENLYEGFYVCQTAYNSLLTTYISTDGENYIKLSESNMECSDGSTSCQLSEIDSRSISSWSDLRLSLQLGSNYAAGDNSFSARFGFARFKTSNLNGTMADCPRMTR